MSSTTHQPVALVLGANGRLGAAAVRAFAAAGWSVRAQARRTPAHALPAGASHIDLPLADSAGLAAAAAGARVVVHALNPPYPLWATQALPLLRQGIAVAQCLGARLMLPGNVYNFGAGMPARLDANTPQQPTTRKGRLRVQMEDELRALAASGTLRSSIVRAGDFFGGGTGNWFDLVIVKSLRKGKLVYPGPHHLSHAWAYLPDLARSFVAVAERSDAMPAFVDLPFAGHTLTGTQLLDAIECAASVPSGGARLKRAGMSWTLLRLAGLAVPMLREVAEMSYLWHVPHALDGAAMRRALGPLTSTPIDTAMREALRALDANAEPALAGAAASVRS